MLKENKETIMDDWTWKERKMRQNLEEIAREDKRRGKKVWINYEKIRIDETQWKWNEKEEVLKDWRDRVWKGMQRGDEEEKTEEQKRERGGIRGTREKGEEEKAWGVMFWNVAGLGNKDKDFQEELDRWEVLVLMETWTKGDGRK